MQYKINSDAIHPREHEVVRLVGEYLHRANFPLYRIAVTVGFTVGVTAFSNHKLHLELEKGAPTGKVELIYNTLFLMQRPAEFFKDVVPHEVAHVLANVSAFKQGKEIKEHGLEWVEWVTRLAPESVPSKHGPGEVFDARAVLLDQGGIPVIVADCKESCRFNVIPQRKGVELALRNGELTCSSECKKSYRVGNYQDAPAEVLRDLEFIRDIKVRRLSSTA